MCGRYTIIAKAEDLKTRYKILDAGAFENRYNAAPTQLLPVITNREPDAFTYLHWGIISNMAKNKSISTKLINTMAETLEEKASFKAALKFRRCIVPADGYYEWKTLGKKTKVPYRISLKNNELFSFAGLWEEFEDNNGKMVRTFTIITTRANSSITQIHDRMPVILSSEAERKWLDNSLASEEHMQLLKPVESSKIDMYTVSPMVNDVNNDHPSLIKHTPSADQFGNYTLFG